MLLSPFGRGLAAGGSRRRNATPTVPNIVGIPTITGTGKIGEQNSVIGFSVTGNPAPTIGYSWQIAGEEVGTDSTYTPTEADFVGAASGFSSGFSSGFAGAPMLSCIISAENTAGAATPVETAAIPIFRYDTGLLSARIAQDAAKVGDTLSATYTADGAEGLVVTYQWRRNALPISGAVGSTWIADDAGEVACDVTGTRGGSANTIRTDAIRVVHQRIAGVVGTSATTSLAASATAAAAEITDQVFLFLVNYEGPAPTSFVAGGVTLSTFADGASATNSGKTLTLLDGDLQGTVRSYIFALEGLTGTKDVTYAFTTGSSMTYGKLHCYQISGYDLDRAVATFSAPASASTLSAQVSKPVNGIAVVMANRMPSLSVTPSGWTLGFATDQSPHGWDVISGYVYGQAAYQGGITFSQPIPTPNQQVIAVAMPPLGPVFPEITSTPTISGGAVPVEGVPITLNIASVLSGTERVLVQVYQDTTPRIPVSEAIEYEIGSADPAPTYEPTFSDVGLRLLQGQTPVAGSQNGIEVLSAPTGVVLAAGAFVPPDLLASNKFTFVGTSAANGGLIYSGGVLIQRADATIKSGISEPAGWKLALLRSLTPGLTRLSTDVDMASIKVLTDPSPGGLGIPYNGTVDVLWRSSGGASDEVVQYLYAWWKHTASGAIYEALAAPLSFVSDVGEPPAPDPTEPAANETLSSASASALLNAINARIATGSTAQWVIDLPAGNYGDVGLSGKILPGKTILRSANRNLGAIFTGVWMENSKNINFWHCKFTVRNRARTENSIQQSTGQVVYARSTDSAGFEFCEFDCGPAIRRSAVGRTGPGWMDHIAFGLDMYAVGADTVNPRVYMCWFHGSAAAALQIGNGSGGYIAENVFSDICGDDIQIGWVRNTQFINNWGARIKYPSYSPEDGWIHPDFIQTNSKTLATPGNQYVGNVFMKGNWNTVPGGGWTGIPSQGLFGSGSILTNHLFDNNIVCTSTPNAIMYAGTAGMAGNVARNNTCLFPIDDLNFSTHHSAQLVLGGATTLSRNVQCASAGMTNMGSDGLNIVMVASTRNYSASLAYYTSVYMNSSFYEMRPVAGAVTHWGYTAGAKQGAWRRWQDVIVLGRYPKKGPAAAAWKASYDPRNQITS